MKKEEENILEAIKAARKVQEFLWSDMNNHAGLEEFRRMFRKRLFKMDEINMSNPYWRTELRKRLLQTAAIAINALTKLDNGGIINDGIHPTLSSNLPEFKK